MAGSHHLQAFNDLRKLKIKDVRGRTKLKDAVLLKTGAFQTGQFHDEECERLARLFVSLVEDVLANRYDDVSVRCFTHACAALDYLLDPQDEQSDDGPGGLEDDARKLRTTMQEFHQEFDAYAAWRKRMNAEA
jgi:hypothetical protein